MTPELILILGGVRSGKSAFAEGLARVGSKVLFVATAEAGDADMKERIAAHRRRRPAAWDTLEAPLHLCDALEPVAARYDTVVVDCLTLWVSNVLLAADTVPLDTRLLTETDRLLRIHQRAGGRWIVVSNEVGLGVVPPTELGRTYRDALGRVNQAVARRADRVYLLVAGLALDLKALGAQPFDDLTRGLGA